MQPITSSEIAEDISKSLVEEADRLLSDSCIDQHKEKLLNFLTEENISLLSDKDITIWADKVADHIPEENLKLRKDFSDWKKILLLFLVNELNYRHGIHFYCFRKKDARRIEKAYNINIKKWVDRYRW